MKLDNRTKSLIAVGASITANCQPCLQSTVTMALQSGADEQEIAEAVEIGKRVRQGATSRMDAFTPSLVQAAPSSASAADSGCGCG